MFVLLLQFNPEYWLKKKILNKKLVISDQFSWRERRASPHLEETHS